MLSKPFNFFICFLFLFTIPNSFFVKAATSNVDLIQQNWPFNGIFGRFDKASLQRGFKVYSEVCSACHGLRHISYRDLEGEMFTREAKMSDKFVGPYENDKIARLANNGAYPPDLSLIVKARGGGADYIYSLLNGYKDFPENFEASEGMYYNEYYPGNQIAMPPQIEDDIVEFDDGTMATHNQIARDITSFLAWTAEPELEKRKSLGVKTLFFLVLITIMLLGVKRKVWKNLD